MLFSQLASDFPITDRSGALLDVSGEHLIDCRSSEMLNRSEFQGPRAFDVARRSDRDGFGDAAGAGFCASLMDG